MIIVFEIMNVTLYRLLSIMLLYYYQALCNWYYHCALYFKIYNYQKIFSIKQIYNQFTFKIFKK